MLSHSEADGNSLVNGQLKKGIGMWSSPTAQASLAASRVSWYYDWTPNQQTVLPGGGPPPGVEFVPMVWGAEDVTPARLAMAQALGTTLLGFNEPDRHDQANMSVEQALALWPQLVATGIRLGSPVAAELPWLQQFMSGARERGYRVDFVCLHWYGPDAATWASGAAVQELRDFLVAAHDQFKLPIWLTEFALVDWGMKSGRVKTVYGGMPTTEIGFPTWEQQAAFIRSATGMLDTLPFVERYAWFSLECYFSVPNDTLHMFGDDGVPTPAAVAYRSAR